MVFESCSAFHPLRPLQYFYWNLDCIFFWVFFVVTMVLKIIEKKDVAKKIIETESVLAKIVVTELNIIYDTEKIDMNKWQSLQDAVSKSGASTLWELGGELSEPDPNGGRRSSLQREARANADKMPAWISSNVQVSSFEFRGRSIFFFPDRVVVDDGNKMATVPYSQIDCVVFSLNYIEDIFDAPAAPIVGWTWLRCKKDGTRDLRFKDNRKIPIKLYEVMNLSDRNGFDEAIMFSMPGVASDILNAINQYKVNFKENVIWEIA